jgi:hypothetical protein
MEPATAGDWIITNTNGASVVEPVNRCRSLSVGDKSQAHTNVLFAIEGYQSARLAGLRRALCQTRGLGVGRR